MYEDKKCAVIGAGRSGRGVARLLTEHGATVFVSDASPELTEEARQDLESIGAEIETGGHSDKVLECDLIVLSPGVDPEITIVKRAIDAAIPVTNEVEVASAFCRGTIIGITGTNGKTTTTELAGHILRSAGRKTFVAGNVGMALSNVVQDTDDHTTTVIELSSFQLERIQTFHPHVSVLLNVTPDHLDRYRSIEEYGSAKLRIMMNQTPDDTVIYNADDDWLTRVESFDLRPTGLRFSLNGPVARGAWLENSSIVLNREAGEPETLLDVDEMKLTGPHNWANAMAAALAVDAVGLSTDEIRRGLVSFEPLPHRMEEVGVVDGVRYVNDSKGTNTEALKNALESFARPIVLIAGGRAKQNEYLGLMTLVGERVKCMIVIGEEADTLESAFGGLTEIENAGRDFERAVKLAREKATEGDVVLLSPACASFDMFSSFVDRGERFRSLVNAMATENT